MSAAAAEKHRNKWGSVEDQLSALMEKMREEERKEEEKKAKPKKGNTGASGDLRVKSQAEDCVELINTAIGYVKDGLYGSAESLLRFLFRIAPVSDARKPISSARRLLNEANRLETQWVKRRAKLMRDKKSALAISAEKKKYAFQRRDEVLDLLTTATLVLNDDIQLRQGNYYVDVTKTIEVVLPPLLDATGIPQANVPIIFFTDRRIDQRKFSEVFQASHGMEPDLKDLSNNTYLLRNARVAGFTEKKMSVKDAEKKYQREASPKSKLLEHQMVHHSSELFWYLVDFPVSVMAVYFGDTQITDSYGGMNIPAVNRLELSADEFVRMRNEERLRLIRTKAAQQREQRLAFESSVKEYMDEINQIDTSLMELREVTKNMRAMFASLTALEVDEETLEPVDGLAIDRYKNLRSRMLAIYDATAPRSDLDERRKVRQLIADDEMKARILYHDHAEMRNISKGLRERRANMAEIIDQLRHIERGSGKMAEKAVELD